MHQGEGGLIQHGAIWKLILFQSILSSCADNVPEPLRKNAGAAVTAAAEGPMFATRQHLTKHYFPLKQYSPARALK